MDQDFMANLANMLKNGNIPDEIKEKMGSFMNNNANSANTSTRELLLTDNADKIAPILILILF